MATLAGAAAVVDFNSNEQLASSFNSGGNGEGSTVGGGTDNPIAHPYCLTTADHLRPPASSTSVPEPSSLLLVSLTGAAVFLRRRSPKTPSWAI